MTGDLKLLAGIQSLDARILAARTELEHVPHDVERLEAERRGHGDALGAVKARREAGAKNRRALELEVESRNAAIRKLQAQQIQVKTNKEYTAMLHEIEGTKRAILGLEEQILVEMENGDALAAAEKESQKTYDAESGRVGREQDALRARAAGLQSAADAWGAERASAVAGLSRDVLTAYQRIFQGRAGQAIVPVDNGACGGCGAPLPPQLVNEVRKMETLITCETCGRILVWNQEPK
jgi:uncharacterized protein